MGCSQIALSLAASFDCGSVATSMSARSRVTRASCESAATNCLGTRGHGYCHDGVWSLRGGL